VSLCLGRPFHLTSERSFLLFHFVIDERSSEMLRGCRGVAISGFRQDFNDPLIVWFVPFLLPPTPPLSNTLFARDHQTTYNLQFPRPSNLCSSLIPLALSGMTFQVTRRLSFVVRRRSGHTRRHRTELKFQEDDPLPPPCALPALLLARKGTLESPSLSHCFAVPTG